MRCIFAAVLFLVCVPGSTLSASPAKTGKSPLSEFKWHLADNTPCNFARTKWIRHYAPYTRQLRGKDARMRLLFNSVVSKVVAAGLPSEYALIPFVESHYKPAARSPLGPAGLWQFTAATARNHGLQVHRQRDDRLNAVRSTDAAIQYLRHLHRMFKGDEESVLMAFNAGEDRLKASKRKRGRPLSGITHVYPDKISAVSCGILRQGD